jgi:hypothetical protein
MACIILHNDPSAPTVIPQLCINVGAEGRELERTGLHTFEHQYEGTETLSVVMVQNCNK